MFIVQHENQVSLVCCFNTLHTSSLPPAVPLLSSLVAAIQSSKGSPLNGTVLIVSPDWSLNVTYMGCTSGCSDNHCLRSTFGAAGSSFVAERHDDSSCLAAAVEQHLL